MHVAMLLFPDLTQLDLTGPYEVLARLPDTTVHLVAKTREPVRSEFGLALLPTATFEDCPTAIDLLFVPGGVGQIAATDDAATLAWLRRTGDGARWITSACTGSLLLGAAGLLKGYRATSHWSCVDLLPLVGATPVPDERVVIDRNRITAGGVTAGIDAALAIAAEIAGRETAERIQLMIEYDPHPPFTAGHPRSAPPAVLAAASQGLLADRHAKRAAQLKTLGLAA